jgi:hypothetical protein
MNMVAKPFLLLALLGTFAAHVCAESNDSLQSLTNAQAAVELKLNQFANTPTNYQLLVDAQKISASLNPRGGQEQLSALDERCLRLQLKVLIALQEACDPHYDRNAETNAVYLNLVPPPAKSGLQYPSGIAPQAIKDPEVRRGYEEAIAKNQRRNAKLEREMTLSRGVDHVLMNIWIFTKRGFPQNSAARKQASEIVQKTLPNKNLVERFNSESMPGPTW